MSINSPIVIGIVSGLLTSIIILVVSTYFKKVFLPWVHNLVYQGARVNRVWRAEFTTPSGNKVKAKMALKQRAEKIDGVINMVKRLASSGKTEFRDYIISGGVRDRFIVLTGRNAEKGDLGIYSTLLEIVGNGKTLQGISVWYSISADKIDSAKVDWRAE